MLLLNYDFYDIYAVLLSFRNDPSNTFNEKIAKTIKALLESPQVDNVIESNIIRRSIAEIENLDIERSKGLTSDTHFWNMVNIGTTENPRWYFFDATRYAGRFTVGGDNGCLLTLSQLEGYKASNSKYDGVYYTFDEDKYPAAQTEIINDKYSFK